jgi:hypothetical protein
MQLALTPRTVLKAVIGHGLRAAGNFGSSVNGF